MNPNIEISHSQERSRFHTFVNEQECYLQYRKVGPTMLEFYNVFVPVGERQQGIGTELVKEALRYAQLNNFLVAPTCNFVAHYLDEHPEFDKMRVEAE